MIRKIIWLIILVILFVILALANRAFAPKVEAESISSIATTSPKVLSISDLIKQKADKYGVSADVMQYIVDHESMGSTTIQSRCRDKYGNRERSFGLVQIHLPDWPEITLEQTYDPDFSLEFLAYHLSEGRCYLWATCPI